MSSKSKLGIIALAFFLVPLVSFAQFEHTTQIFLSLNTIVGNLTPFAAALALLYFFWGLAKFILKADNEEARDEGRMIMKWGIIALFVIVSIWGIVKFIQTELGGPFVGSENIRMGIPGYDVGGTSSGAGNQSQNIQFNNDQYNCAPGTFPVEDRDGNIRCE